MPRKITEFDVFVSSPSDVADERDYVVEAVDELNANWQRQLGLRLNVLRWEDQGLPGFGEDSQDVVNQDFPEPWDAFIGILWSRIGTPTRRAESGTVEEFERAYKQWETEPETIRLMMYFKNEDVPFDQIDVEQISRVRAFKDSLSRRGCRYQDFTATKEFRQLIKKHLTLLAQRLAKRQDSIDAEHEPRPPKSTVAGPAVVVAGAALAVQAKHDAQTQTPDEEGLLDLVERYQHEMSTVATVAESMTESTEILGAQTTDSVSKLNQLDLRQNPQHLKQAKREVNALAWHLQSFANRMSAEAPVMRESFDAANAAFEGAIDIAPDFGEEGIRSIKSNEPTVEEFIETLEGTFESISEMRLSILGVPRTTTRFNRARRAAVRSLDDLLYTLTSAKRVMESSLKVLRALN